MMLYLNLNGTIIPDDILAYLPAKVKEYAETNFENKDIMIVINGLGANIVSGIQTVPAFISIRMGM